MSECIAFTLHGVPVWMREDDYEEGEGPLMPEPDHDINSGPFADSYAHLCEDGNIRRYGNVIGTRDDLVRVEPSHD